MLNRNNKNIRPLILEFAETPTMQNLDFSLIEYSRKQNLSVLKGTEKVAVTYANLNTETFTKANQEPTDSDNDLRRQVKSLLNTSTETRTIQEPSDNDTDRRQQIKYLLDTRTETLTRQEASDSDSDLSSLIRLMDTQTITESQEPTDADK